MLNLLTSTLLLNLAGLARYERRFTGAVLVRVGVAGFFVDW